MAWTSEVQPSTPTHACGVRLLDPSKIADCLALVRADGYLSVVIPPPGPGRRGQLGVVIETAIEDVLQRRGAAPPGMSASSDLDASLSDQLFRARGLGATGIVLGFPALEGIANLAGTLDAEDSAVLRWWVAATRERPVRLVLSYRDRFLGIYGPPVSLQSLGDDSDAGVGAVTMVASPSEPATGVTLTTPCAAPEIASSVATMDLSPLPPRVGATTLGPLTAFVERGHDEKQAEQGPLPPASTPAERDGEMIDTPASGTANDQALATGVVSENPESPPPTDPPTTSGWAVHDRGDQGPCCGDEQSTDSAHQPESSPRQTADDQDPMREPDSASPGANAAAMAALFEDADLFPGLQGEPSTPGAPEGEASDPSETQAPSVPAVTGLREILEDLLPRRPDVRAAPVEQVDLPEDPSAQSLPSPLHPDAPNNWQRWVDELDAARGPRPLAAIERMFVSAYVPLQDALMLGIAGDEAQGVLGAWAQSFEKSYAEAFDALRVRGKRPTMVLDAPDIAQRMARLHGARTTQLLLVDGLRFDVGQRLHEHLRGLVGQRAALTERLLLWSALPTTTSAQLSLLARGAEGLKESAHPSETNLPVARGRAAHTLRRVRAGSRELMKLDLVEARLAQRDPIDVSALDTLARESAEAIAQHFERLRARTLVLVFGDHGFTLDGQSGSARQGGARPEEVLVPASAWLVGDVH